MKKTRVWGIFVSEVAFYKELSKRGFLIEQNIFESLDSKRKSLQVEVETLQSERNKLSTEFGKKKKTGESTEQLKIKVDEINSNLKIKEDEFGQLTLKLNDFLIAGFGIDFL